MTWLLTALRQRFQQAGFFDLLQHGLFFCHQRALLFQSLLLSAQALQLSKLFLNASCLFQILLQYHLLATDPADLLFQCLQLLGA